MMKVSPECIRMNSRHHSHVKVNVNPYDRIWNKQRENSKNVVVVVIFHQCYYFIWVAYIQRAETNLAKLTLFGMISGIII